jgi:hypothetical protein
MQDKFIVDYRKSSRHNLVCSVIITDGKKESFGLIKNVSEEGLKVESASKLSLHSNCNMSFILPHGKELRLKGRFIWMTNSDSHYTYGAKISSIGLFNRFKLKKYLRSLGNS